MTDTSRDQAVSHGEANRTAKPPRKAEAMPSAVPAGDPTLDSPRRQPERKSRSATVWVTLVVSAIVLALLLVFLLQNADQVGIHFFGWFGVIPLGIAMTFAAVAGVVIVAVPAGVRILQLRHRGGR